MRSLLLLLAGLLTTAQAEEFLPGVKRILFLGDSITHAGQYIDHVEAFLFTQYPERKFEVINGGLPSETVSGLSEEGHAGGAFPRPDLHERLDRVLTKTKPDLVFACYGMNDGIYLPLEEGRFQKFQDGIKRLHAAVEKAGAQIIHLTPPVFDPGPGEARETSYDAVLTRYTRWLLAQTAGGWRVIDLHGPMSTALDAARAKDPKFTFSKDHVHPDEAGQKVLADALLAGLQSEKWPQFQKTTIDSTMRSRISERARILRDAWLTETGHRRPGMGKGLPPAEAQEKAAKLEAAIRGQ